ncbi:D-alanine/D-serine/glycine permease [Sinomonas humi]|uniref:D-alanine/D-serine/glycine permease n=2 Tax=Sinomonas humi TaxID=1338436 RepID=A0A0B2AKC8_9MICC|nr:D-alanine/D-serine/glycine permease [Sinomonas humi]
MSTADRTPAYEKENLKRDLKSRHLQMIAIGGAIGTGLFYGSGWAIQTAGPAIILTYLVAAAAIYFVMRAQGEMSVEEPVSGGYISYSSRYFHPFMGFLNGWNAFIFLLASSAAELNALGKYIQYWAPGVPIWVTAAIAVFVLFAINVVGVKFYGESEFWFAIVKVLAIVALIVFGLAMIFFGLGNGGQPVGFANLTAHGGFFPNGISGSVLSVVMVAFAFGGIENLGLAAGEAKDVEKSMPKAVNATFWRLLLFYVGAITILVAIYPWTSLTGKGSPFVDVFVRIGIPAAATIMNLVVMTAVLSAVNSSIFTNSRTFYNLSLQGKAPAFLGKVNGKQVPSRAVLTVFVIMLAGVVLNAAIPNDVFQIFSSVTTFGLICAWSSIVISHLRFRRLRIRNGQAEAIKYKAPFYPYADYIALVFVAVVLVCIAILPDMQVSLLISAAWVLVVFIAYRIYRDRGRRNVSHSDEEDLFTDPVTG